MASEINDVGTNNSHLTGIVLLILLHNIIVTNMHYYLLTAAIDRNTTFCQCDDDNFPSTIDMQ